MFTKHIANYIKNNINILIALIPSSLLFSPFVNTILLMLALLFSIVNISKSKTKEAFQLILKYKFLSVTVIAFSLFLLMHIIGLLYTENYEAASSIIKKRSALIVFPFILLVIYRDINFNFIKLFFVGFVLLACIYTNLNSLFSIIANNEPLEFFYNKNLRFEYEKLMFYKIHPPYFGAMVNIAICIVFFQLKRKSINIYISFFSILFLTINLYLISSQMSLIIFGGFVIILIFRILYRSVKRSMFYTLLVFFIMFMSLILLKGQNITKTLIKKYNIENRNSFLKRVNHFYELGDLTRKRNWESGIKAFKDNVLIGSGTGDAIDQMLNYRHKKSWIYLDKINAHNQYIEELVRFGLIGFLSFICLLTVLGIFLIKKKLFSDFLILTVLSFSMVTESMLNRQIGIILFGFFITFSFFNILKESK